MLPKLKYIIWSLFYDIKTKRECKNCKKQILNGGNSELNCEECLDKRIKTIKEKQKELNVFDEER